MDEASRLIASALDRLIAAGIRQREALAKDRGSPSTDILLLHYVVAGNSSPSDLARALLLSPSGASAVIDRLVRAGLISRAPGSGRRRVVVTATDAGRELHAGTLAPLAHDVGRLVEELPRRDRVLLEQFLARLADLAEREADQLIARAAGHARTPAVIPPPVLWG